MIQKLKSTSGETITEVLVASLIVVLGVLLYAMMVNASFRIINTAENGMKKLYENESLLEDGSATDSSEAKVSIAETGITNPGDLDDVFVNVYSADEIKTYEYKTNP